MRRFVHDRSGVRLSAHVLDGRALARRMRTTLRDDVAAFVEMHGFPPRLVAIGSAADPAADTYLTLKLDAARSTGIRLDPVLLPAQATTAEAVACVERAVSDPSVHAIFVQYPLPGIDADAITRAIPPEKDVDGASTLSRARLHAGQQAFAAASADAVMALLADAPLSLRGARAVLGPGVPAIAEPLGVLLERAGARLARPGTDVAALRAAIAQADVIVFPGGVPSGLQPADLPDDAVVVDAAYFGRRGARRDILSEAAPRLAACVPGRGGVGPVTVAVLLRNTLEAARAQVRPG